VAAYQYSKNALIALGAGLDGPVATIVPLQMNITEDKPETVIGFSGTFTNILATGNSPASFAQGFTVWVPSHNDWLQNLNVSRPVLNGQVTSYADVPNGSFLLAGSLVFEGIAISGAASLSEYDGTEGLDAFPFKIQPDSARSPLSRR